MAASPESFFARLEARVGTVDSLLCVGLDPHGADIVSATHTSAHTSTHPHASTAEQHEVAREVNAASSAAERAYYFCIRIIDATSEVAAAYKPNAAFFEALGSAGVRVCERVCAYIRALNIPILLDAKRGDIASTADAYAEAAYDAMGADAVTLHPYMGADSITPFTHAHTRSHTRGVFVLCKTSNATSNELQSLPLASGQLLYERVAEFAAGPWNTHCNVGLVVGSTDPVALARVRDVAPEAWILAPGVGFQGGDLEAALRAGLRKDASGLLLPVSRGISRAADMRAAAHALKDAINAVRRRFVAPSAIPTGAPAMTPAELLPHQKEFILAALSAGVLRFGEFTLKSGRISPYFFNAGHFSTGAVLAVLGRTYARAIQDAKIEFDVLFGPAYKGIPLVTAAAIALASVHAVDVPIAYNRKEAKDHGEGGVMVGTSVRGKRVLIVDDVITAGTAIGEAISAIQAAGGTPVGVVIGLDRQEVGTSYEHDATVPRSAVQQVRATFGLQVTAVATLQHLVAFVANAVSRGETVPGLEGMSLTDILERMHAYRAKYGAPGE